MAVFGSFLILVFSNMDVIFIVKCTKKAVGMLSMSEDKMLLFVKIAVSLLIKRFCQIS